MNENLLKRKLLGRTMPIRVGVVGAGDFGCELITQVSRIANMEIAVVADLKPERAVNAFLEAGYKRLVRLRIMLIQPGRQKVRVIGFDQLLAVGRRFAAVQYSEKKIRVEICPSKRGTFFHFGLHSFLYELGKA